MADLTTAQKAPVSVTDSNGDPVIGLNDDHVSVEGTSITAHVDVEQATFFVTAVEAGDSVLSVDINGEHGELAISVAAGSLTITLGTPVPK